MHRIPKPARNSFRDNADCLSKEGSLKVLQLMGLWLILKNDRRAVTALEYGLIAAVIVAVITLGFTQLADSLSAQFATIGEDL
jgi:Flp pilus assembly pilin Flp